MRIIAERTPFRGRTLYQTHVRSQASQARPLAQRMVAAIADRGLLVDGEREKYEVCLREAILNAIVHGNREDENRLVYARVFLSDGEWGFVVEDGGEGFDPAAVPDPDASEFASAERGRGIHLMHHVMDRVEFFWGGRTVVLTKEFDIVDFPGLLCRRPSFATNVRLRDIRGTAVATPVVEGADIDALDRVFDNLTTLVEQRPPGRLVLDVSGVTYLDSHGIGRLVAVARRCQEHDVELRLAAAGKQLRELLLSMRLETVLRLDATVDDAVDADRPTPAH